MVIENPLSANERVNIIKHVFRPTGEGDGISIAPDRMLAKECYLGEIYKLPNGQPFDRIIVDYEGKEGLGLSFAWGDMLAHFALEYSFERQESGEVEYIYHTLPSRSEIHGRGVVAKMVYNVDQFNGMKGLAALRLADTFLAMCEVDSKHIEIVPDGHPYYQMAQFFKGSGHEPGDSNQGRSR